MIRSDNHIHTSFSSDSETPMEAMIERGRALGLTSLCFTDHMDYGFPEKYEMDFVFSPEDYFAKIKALSVANPDIILRTGVELGLKEDIYASALSLTDNYAFDFIIGSTHLVDNTDPYYMEYWESHGESGGIRHYYEATLRNILQGFDFDVYGHIDYVIRYCPSMKNTLSLSEKEAFCKQMQEENKELIDEILLTLIRTGKGIEVNTGGLKYGLGHPNPHEDILKRYHTLGGTILSIGSDAHETTYLAYEFQKLPKLLQQCGFTEYTEFHKRKPVQLPLL